MAKASVVFAAPDSELSVWVQRFTESNNSNHMSYASPVTQF